MGYVIVGTIVAILAGTIITLVVLLAKTINSLTIFALRNNGNKVRIGKATSLTGTFILVMFFSYTVYEAFYPNDEFFLKEYSRVTLRPAPSSAVIISKRASFPGLHGDYCSYSQIKLSTSEYNELRADISASALFVKTERNTSVNLIETEQRPPIIEAASIESNVASFDLKEYKKGIPVDSDHFYTIRFLPSGDLIEIDLCVL